MRSKTRLLFAIASAFLATTWAGNPSDSAVPANGLILQQNCQYHGSVLVKMANNGSRVDSQNLSIFVEPDATAYIYNNSNKTWCSLSHQMWMDKYSIGTSAGAPVQTGTGVVAGQQCNHYWCGCFTKADRTKPRFKLEWWACKTLPISKVLMDEYSALCGLPRGYGMPLRIYRHYGDENPGTGKTTIFLETYRIVPATIKAAELARPVGYKQMKDDVDVIMADDLDEISDLLSDDAPKRAPSRPRAR